MRELADKLRSCVTFLSSEIGERNTTKPAKLARAADFLKACCADAGYVPLIQAYDVEGLICENIEVSIPGTTRADEIVIIGAHYDSVFGCPGANDNGTGVAALLALARHFAGTSPERTLRFVAFVNEEPPYFCTSQMGSMVYATQCRARDEDVVAMVNLETMGCYSDEPDSQEYPSPVMGMLFPSVGNFIAFVSNEKSAGLLDLVADTFQTSCSFPAERAAVPEHIAGIAWSDHWSFWRNGYAAVMVTDTAPFRYQHYHLATDTADRIDYDRLARVVEGLKPVIETLANG